MYVKISHKGEETTINLTMEYVQEEEEYPTQVLDEEEKQQVRFLLVSDVFISKWYPYS